MRIARSSEELRVELVAERSAEHSIGFVATMGALHAGHLSLVGAAREASDVVVVSIFVNPTQFGPGEDYSMYPRDEATDVRLLEEAGADIVFLPDVDDMYPPGASTTVSTGELGDIVEGASRPGHFDGVATIVTKLLNVVQPDVAFFGRKDAQQLAVVQRVVSDLSLPVEIRGCPTVREPDGLALSSRNVRLDAGERERATSLFRALEAGARVLREERSVRAAEKTMLEILVAARSEPDYASVLDPQTFVPYSGTGPALLAVAARIGGTRLIDNLLVEDASTTLED